MTIKLVAGGRLNAHRNSGRNSGQVKRNLKVGLLTTPEMKSYMKLTQKNKKYHLIIHISSTTQIQTAHTLKRATKISRCDNCLRDVVAGDATCGFSFLPKWIIFI